MNIYKYHCNHKGKCKPLADRVRQCIECGMVIITDRGVYSEMRVDDEL